MTSLASSEAVAFVHHLVRHHLLITSHTHLLRVLILHKGLVVHTHLLHAKELLLLSHVRLVWHHVVSLREPSEGLINGLVTVHTVVLRTRSLNVLTSHLARHISRSLPLRILLRIHHIVLIHALHVIVALVALVSRILSIHVATLHP